MCASGAVWCCCCAHKVAEDGASSDGSRLPIEAVTCTPYKALGSDADFCTHAMNDSSFKLMEAMVPASYARQAQQARRARESLVKSLLAQRRLPDNGLDEGTLRLVLQEMALLDSNTFVGNAGVGEREGRVICPLVASRHFGLAHGIGRSGDIAEAQPKAAGSSLIYTLTNALAADALRRALALPADLLAPRRAPAFEPLSRGRVALLSLRLACVFLLEERLRLLLLALALAALGYALAHGALASALGLAVGAGVLCLDHRGFPS